jgi:hypothetical protein
MGPAGIAWLDGAPARIKVTSAAPTTRLAFIDLISSVVVVLRGVIRHNNAGVLRSVPSTEQYIDPALRENAPVLLSRLARWKRIGSI